MTWNTESKTLVARKNHRCTNCGQLIQVGDQYVRWMSFDESAFTSKMHPECLSALQEDAEYGQFEYTPYSGERPSA